MAAIQCAECGRFCGEADFASGHCHYTPEAMLYKIYPLAERGANR
jgi:hypothetical protein